MKFIVGMFIWMLIGGFLLGGAIKEAGEKPITISYESIAVALLWPFVIGYGIAGGGELLEENANSLTGEE